MKSWIEFTDVLFTFISLMLLKYTIVDFYSQLSTINYKNKFLCHYKKVSIRHQRLALTEAWKLNTSCSRNNEVLRKMSILKKHNVFTIGKSYFFLILRFSVCEKAKFSVLVRNLHLKKHQHVASRSTALSHQKWYR